MELADSVGLELRDPMNIVLGYVVVVMFVVVARELSIQVDKSTMDIHSGNILEVCKWSVAQCFSSVQPLEEDAVSLVEGL